VGGWLPNLALEEDSGGELGDRMLTTGSLMRPQLGGQLFLKSARQDAAGRIDQSA
jgi:hypothetical protein